MDTFTGNLLQALLFAAHFHSQQRRKGATHEPYINHPIAVAELLWRCGVHQPEILIAAVLHDTLEDTAATPQDLTERFGAPVCALVQEVSDDKSLPKAERKRLQILHAAQVSQAAKAIKLADKTCNLRDLSVSPPPDWSAERLLEYVLWAERVAAGLRGNYPALEQAFDQALAEAKNTFQNNQL